MARRKQYWLMKSEPSTFSIQDLAACSNQTEPWDGVRNYQARNYMRDDMKVGDGILFHHSNAKPPGIAGLATVASGAYPDPTAFDEKSHYFDPKSDPENPRWMLVDVKLDRIFDEPVPLPLLKETAGLEDMMLLQRGSRLSIQPVTAAQWKIVLGLARRLARG